MGRVAVIGEQTAVSGYALAGVLVLSAEDDEAVRGAWSGLPEDVQVVILTARAARTLGEVRIAELHPFTVVMPS
ncbi:MAG: V-type ATP synthase subunit F [Mycobacterium sp.]